MIKIFHKLKKIYNKYTNGDGFDKNGNNYYTGKKYDRNGYNMSGYDEDGYDRNGYNKKGYDRSGYDRYGYDKDGYNKEGYGMDGYNKYGYNSHGYNKYGYINYDWNGYGYGTMYDDPSILWRDEKNKKILITHKYGYDKDGYNKEGFDIYGIHKSTGTKYNKEGYDKDGYNINGYDKEGYDRYGYDMNGYDKDGFDRYGYDINGYDENGYDIDGFNREGFNKFGFDEGGYDREGYDINGYNRNGEYKYKKGEIKKITTKKPQTKNEKNKEIINDKKPIFKVFFFDTETTGTTPGKDYIIQFGGIFGELNFETREFKEIEDINQFINVPVKIPEGASKVHGICNKDLIGYGYINEYIDKFLSFFKECDYAIGHNVDFDRGMIRGEVQRLEIPFKFDSIKRVDTMKPCTELVGVRNSWGGCKRPKLIELHTFLFGEEFDGAHDAMTDIRATKDCFIELCKNYNFYSNGKFSSNVAYEYLSNIFG